MDIDDILASVDRSSTFTTPESASIDHQLLTRFWVAERAVPELLPWPGSLMDRVMERVGKQIEAIEDLAASSSDPFSKGNTNNPNLNLKLSILQTDLSRTQYIIRSLLRQRIDKLTKHSMHYLLLISPSHSSTQPSQSQSQNPNQTPEDSLPAPPSPSSSTSPLSAKEAAFLHTHQTLLARHYNTSFLGAFPSQLRRLDDNAGGTKMVQGPDEKEVVFVRCLVDEVRAVVPAGDGIDEELEGVTM
ncbi:hypothetical protein PHISCL_08989, partial [Aspergillus sclerotialis]